MNTAGRQVTDAAFVSADQEVATAKTEKRRDSEGQPPPIPEKVCKLLQA